MNHPLKTTSRPQLALQSYLDALLQDATEEPLSEVVEDPEALDEFQAAVGDLAGLHQLVHAGFDVVLELRIVEL